MHTVLTIAGAIVIFLFVKENAMKEKKNRRLRVYGQSNGYNYQDVPTIVLKGKWLEVAGFDIGDSFMLEVVKDGLVLKKIASEN